jgi:hypothetical protein
MKGRVVLFVACLSSAACSYLGDGGSGEASHQLFEQLSPGMTMSAAVGLTDDIAESLYWTVSAADCGPTNSMITHSMITLRSDHPPAYNIDRSVRVAEEWNVATLATTGDLTRATQLFIESAVGQCSDFTLHLPPWHVPIDVDNRGVIVRKTYPVRSD